MLCGGRLMGPKKQREKRFFSHGFRSTNIGTHAGHTKRGNNIQKPFRFRCDLRDPVFRGRCDHGDEIDPVLPTERMKFLFFLKRNVGQD